MLRSSLLNIRHQEREAWRTRLIEAAQGVASSWTSAIVAVESFSRRDTELDGKDRETFDAAILRFAEATNLAILIFGQETVAGKAADESRSTLSEAVRIGRSAPETGQDPGALEQLEASDKAHNEFMGAAHERILSAEE